MRLFVTVALDVEEPASDDADLQDYAEAMAMAVEAALDLDVARARAQGLPGASLLALVREVVRAEGSILPT